MAAVDMLVNPESVFPIRKDALGTLAALVLHVDMTALFVRCYLPLLARLRLVATSRSMQLAFNTLHRAVSDELAYFTRVVPQFVRPAAWMTKQVMLTAARSWHPKPPDVQHMLHTLDDTAGLLPHAERTIVRWSALGNGKLQVIVATLHPTTHLLPWFDGNKDTNMFSFDMLAARVVGYLEYVPRSRKFWRFEDAAYGNASTTLSDSPLVSEEARETMTNALQARKRLAPGALLTQRCDVFARLLGRCPEETLAAQGRHFFDYMATLRRMRDDLNVDQHLVDSGDLAIRGVFVLLDRTMYTNSSAPMYDTACFSLCYLGEAPERTVHSVR